MNEETLDRVILKQQRKERKQVKKYAKQLEHQKEHEKRILKVKLGPKDHRVTLISTDFASNIKIPLPAKTNLSFTLENSDHNFPSLEQSSKLKSKPKITVLPETYSANEEQPIESTKHNKPSSITLNIPEILTKPVIPKLVNHAEKESTKYYPYGNMLDASQPERLRGKRREIPKRKPPSKLKSQILSDSKNSNLIKSDYNGVHSAQFETYCDNIITDELNSAVKQFLSDIVRYQENLYKRDSIKGNAKRRYVVGFREVKKFVLIKKIKFIIIAPNIRTVVENGALDTAVHDLISLAKENKIPYIFALSRWKLGEITVKYRPISCVGIFEYSGAEEKYNDVLKLLKTARNSYSNLILSEENSANDESTREIIQQFINACT